MIPKSNSYYIDYYDGDDFSFLSHYIDVDDHRYTVDGYIITNRYISFEDACWNSTDIKDTHIEVGADFYNSIVKRIEDEKIRLFNIVTEKSSLLNQEIEKGICLADIDDEKREFSLLRIQCKDFEEYTAQIINVSEYAIESMEGDEEIVEGEYDLTSINRVVGLNVFNAINKDIISLSESIHSLIKEEYFRRDGIHHD